MEKSKNTNGGRPPDDPFIRLRSFFWYWAVSDKSGLKDGELDLLFSNPKTDGSQRKYKERPKMFEDIRKFGRRITDGGHQLRSFNLVERVNNHPGLEGSRNIYESPLWAMLSARKITLKSTIEALVKLSTLKVLNDAPFTHFVEPSRKELRQLSEFMELPTDFIKQILKPEFDTSLRGLYDSVFDSLGSLVYMELRKKADLRLFATYLDQLAFSIAIYRYSLFSGKFHAMVSSADLVRANLSYFEAAEIKWIPKELQQEFLNLVYTKVFRTPIFTGKEPSLRSLVSQTHNIKTDSALDALIDLLDQLKGIG